MVKFVKNAKISDKILRLKYSFDGVERFYNIKWVYNASVQFKFEQLYELENTFEDLFQKYEKISRTQRSSFRKIGSLEGI